MREQGDDAGGFGMEAALSPGLRLGACMEGLRLTLLLEGAKQKGLAR
jgi:hypothetical protein